MKKQQLLALALLVSTVCGPSKTVAAPAPNKTVAAPSSNKTVAASPPNKTMAAPSSNKTVAASPPNKTMAAPSSNKTVADPSSNKSGVDPSSNKAIADPFSSDAGADAMLSNALLSDAIQEYNAGNLDKAVSLLMQELKKDPESGRAHYYLGSALKKVGADANAVHELEMAIKYCPPGTIQALAKQALHGDFKDDEVTK
jgi:hypothetical protein